MGPRKRRRPAARPWQRWIIAFTVIIGIICLLVQAGRALNSPGAQRRLQQLRQALVCESQVSWILCSF